MTKEMRSEHMLRRATAADAPRIWALNNNFHRTFDPNVARTMLGELQTQCLKRAMPPEVQRLGRTITTWFDKIATSIRPGSPTAPPRRSTT